MRYDEISLKVREIVANLFERDAATLSDDTLLMQDLPCESIDLLEVSVQLGATFHDAQYITCPSTRVSPLQDNEFAFCTKRFVQSATKPVRSTFVIEFSFDDEPAG